MDKNLNAKLFIKKSQMAVEKLKKSASKKKKKSKKSAKSDQSPDNLEVEGIGKFDQTGVDSDSSLARPGNSASPTISNPDSSLVSLGNDQTKLSKPRSSKSTPERSYEPSLLKPTSSASLISYQNNRDSTNKKLTHTVSFSSFSEIKSVTNGLSNMSVKSKNGSTRSKTKSSSKSSVNGATKKDKTSRSDLAKSSASKAAEEAARLRSEESLRWEFALDDEEQERERIKIYKINRRKRYLAAAQAKGLGWVVNYGNNGFPLVDESVTDLRDREPIHATISDFSPVRSVMPSQSNSTMNLGSEIAC